MTPFFSFLYGQTVDNPEVVPFLSYAAFFYKNFDVNEITMVQFVKMIQDHYMKLYPGKRPCVLVAIDEIAYATKSDDSLKTVLSYTGFALSNLTPADFRCIFSALSPTLLQDAVNPSGRSISFISLPLLTYDECRNALL